jgi:hypothetical protein
VVPEPFLEGKHTLSAFAVNPEAQPVVSETAKNAV